MEKVYLMIKVVCLTIPTSFVLSVVWTQIYYGIKTMNEFDEEIGWEHFLETWLFVGSIIALILLYKFGVIWSN